MLLAYATLEAAAGDWRVESDPFADRSRLDVVRAGTVGVGVETRIVRRYVEPGIWVYVAQIDGFDDPSAARVVAAQIVERTGLAMAVRDSTTSATLDRIEPTVSTGALEAAAHAQLQVIIAAHGADPAVLTIAREGPVRFQYRRELSSGLVVDHLWEARGGDLYCRVDVVSGKAKSSVGRIVGSVAEISVEGGPYERQDLDRMRTHLEALGPAEVIPLVLGLTPEAAARPELERLVPAGVGQVGGVPTDILSFAGDPVAPALVLQAGRTDHLVRAVTWRDGAVAHELMDYRLVRGMRVPFTIRTVRADAEDDVVQVQALELGGKLDPAHFRLATAEAGEGRKRP